MKYERLLVPANFSATNCWSESLNVCHLLATSPNTSSIERKSPSDSRIEIPKPLNAFSALAIATSVSSPESFNSSNASFCCKVRAVIIRIAPPTSEPVALTVSAKVPVTAEYHSSEPPADSITEPASSTALMISRIASPSSLDRL